MLRFVFFHDVVGRSLTDFANFATWFIVQNRSRRVSSHFGLFEIKMKNYYSKPGKAVAQAQEKIELHYGQGRFSACSKCSSIFFCKLHVQVKWMANFLHEIKKIISLWLSLEWTAETDFSNRRVLWLSLAVPLDLERSHWEILIGTFG